MKSITTPSITQNILFFTSEIGLVVELALAIFFRSKQVLRNTGLSTGFSACSLCYGKNRKRKEDDGPSQSKHDSPHFDL
jgi:hypothetical protein